MIYKLVVNDKNPKRAVCPWWFQVDWLKDKAEIKFGPGLNVLWGPNGSGKSTVLTTIAKLLCCYDGDQQLVGEHTRLGLTDYDMESGTRILKDGIAPVHDGSPIMHFDPSQSVGLVGGGFDWDFGMAGIQNALFKGSTGETTAYRMGRALACALGDAEWPEVVWKKHGPDSAPDLAALFQGDGNRVRPTLLFDEPSVGLDLMKEIHLFKLLQQIADSGVQVIVATHSVFALHLKGAKFIDTAPHYSANAQIETELHFMEALERRPKGAIEILEGVLKDRAKRVPKGSSKAKKPTQKELLAIVRKTAEGHGKGRGWYKVIKRASTDADMHALKDVKNWYTGPGRYFVSVGKGNAPPEAHFEVNLP